jgi:hypothetical protein
VFKEKVFELAREFSGQTHGATDYDKDMIFVMGANDQEFVPWSFVQKNDASFDSISLLKSEGFVYSGYEFLELASFDQLYQKQFQKKLSGKSVKSLGILHMPDQKAIFDTVEVVYQTHKILKDHKVLVNGQEHLQIEILRNRAHLAKIKVQVSSDLVNWQDGAAHTEVVSEGPLGLIVRDKTPASAHNGRRFMRVQIEPVD